MALGKQAKTLSDRQAKAVLNHLADARYPERNRVMFLLSIKAGLRAKEIANLTWGMVTDSEANIADVIAVQNVASKGKNGGREIPVHPDLKAAMAAIQAHRSDLATPDRPVIYSERGRGMSANSVTVWFHRLYMGLGMEGCSSHSGRRTFVTKAAHKIVEAGGSLRDVQQLAGHSSLATTQRYIEGSNDAKRKVIQMI
jgi:integrase